MKSLDQIKSEGFEVRITHLRHFRHVFMDEGRVVLAPAHIIRKMGFRSQPSGGATLVELKKDGKSACGTSIVHPKDNFDRKLGTLIALRRAMLAWEK